MGGQTQEGVLIAKKTDKKGYSTWNYCIFNTTLYQVEAYVQVVGCRL